MNIDQIALQMLASGKGILAADESTGTMTKRLTAVKVPSTEENRLNFRETLFTSKTASSYISGVILYDETLRQKSSNGTPIPELLRKQNIIPGIKVDAGTKSLAGSPDELITEGLNGLRERLKEYYELGARFTKWSHASQNGELYTKYLLNFQVMQRSFQMLTLLRDMLH